MGSGQKLITLPPDTEAPHSVSAPLGEQIAALHKLTRRPSKGPGTWLPAPDLELRKGSQLVNKHHLKEN